MGRFALAATLIAALALAASVLPTADRAAVAQETTPAATQATPGTPEATPTPGFPVTGTGGRQRHIDTAALLTIVFIAAAGLTGAAWRGAGR